MLGKPHVTRSQLNSRQKIELDPTRDPPLNDSTMHLLALFCILFVLNILHPFLFSCHQLTILCFMSFKKLNNLTIVFCVVFS